jgi:RTA1 like protein
MTVFDQTDSCAAIDPNPDALCSASNTPYSFVPELWLGALFTGVFGVLFIVTAAIAAFRGRRAGYMILAAVCAAGEVAGWVARVQSSLTPFDSDAYVAQMVCLILAPVFISAANYITLERITEYVGHDLSRLKPRYYLIAFISE